MEDKEIDYGTCGFCTEYDCDNYYCPHEGEKCPEDTCYDGYQSEEEKEEELEAQRVDRAERENHRKDVEGEIV